MYLHDRKYITNYAFILPAIAIFALFYIYPFFKVITLSMQQWDGVAFKPAAFVGLSNFKNLIFRDAQKYWVSMAQAGYITFWALTFQNILALLLALACDKAIRTGTIYRVIFFIPPILSEVVVFHASIWAIIPIFLILSKGACLLPVSYTHLTLPTKRIV
mgnify:CR=1 FL=1